MRKIYQKYNQFIKNLSYFRNLCAHDERLYNAINNQNISDTIHHDFLNIPKNNGNYVHGKNDLLSLVIVLKMLLPNDKFNTMCNQIEGRMKSLEKKIKSIDVSEVFDRRWTVNKNKANEAVNQRKEHFNKMFNIQDKTDQRKEILYQNSVEGQVKSLNERMNAMNQGNRINRMNNFRNGFK